MSLAVRRGFCQKCSDSPKTFVSYVDVEVKESTDYFDLNELFARSLVFLNMSKMCCQDIVKLEDFEDQCMIINLSQSVKMDISDKNIENQFQLIYRSHIQAKTTFDQQSFFRFNNMVFTQINAKVFKSYFHSYENVKVIAIFISRQSKPYDFEDVANFIYDQKVLLKLHKQYLKHLKPDQYEAKQNLINKKEKERNKTPAKVAATQAYDKKKNKTPSRIAYKNAFDKERNKTPSRITYKNSFDKERNKTPARIAAKQAYDKKKNKNPSRITYKDAFDRERNKTPARIAYKNSYDKERIKTPSKIASKRLSDKKRNSTSKRKALNKVIDNKRKNSVLRKLQRSSYEHTKNRILYVKERDRKRAEKKLLETLKTETGFDLICSSCLQYKSKHLCKPIETISKAKADRYLIKFCSLLKNRTPGLYVCNLCLRDINKNEMPKRSQINKFKFTRLPSFLIEEWKNNCIFRESSSTFDNSCDQEEYERSFFELNRLEAYLLKLVIPFIRVAHCPRGLYLKIKGDLILISADIDHTMSRVLPVNQNLIPVCFKRRLAYTGSYIEEVIEKKKVTIIFNWLREHNHLYKDLDLDSTLINKYLEDTLTIANEFHRNTRTNELTTSEETESMDELTDVLKDSQYEPAILQEENVLHNKTTIFMNKYSQDPDHPSVVNELASMINDFETENHVSFKSNEDFDVDDEIINEEEFLNIVEKAIEEKHKFEHVPHSKDIVMTDEFAVIQDQLDLDSMEVDMMPYTNNHDDLKDERIDDLDIICNPTVVGK